MLKNIFSGALSKELFAAIAAAGTAFTAANADGVLSSGEVAGIIAAFIAGFGFTLVVPFEAFLKPIVATGISVAAALGTALGNGGGITGNEWYAIVAIVFTAFGTFVFPKATASTVGVKNPRTG